MKLNLSQAGFSLLKHTVTYTGEKEIDQKGVEVDSQRRLNGEESAQRRLFLRDVNPLLEEKRKEAVKLVDNFKEEWNKKNVKSEEETDKEYEGRLNIEISKNKELNESVKSILESEIEVDLTSKTAEVVKKYFKEFGDKNGWLIGDDEAVEEINEKLKD